MEQAGIKREKNKRVSRTLVNEMKIKMPAVSENEGTARGVVGTFAARLDPTVEELADLRCAVSEAVTNSVVHGYGCEGGVLYISIRAYSDRSIYVEIRDKGRGIENVQKAMEPLFTTDGTGERSGMGFAVMQSFTDTVKVRSQPGKGTSVTLIKKLSPTEDVQGERG